MTKEEQITLEEIYEKVLICKNCGKRFGSDLILKEDGVCPICQGRIRPSDNTLSRV